MKFLSNTCFLFLGKLSISTESPIQVPIFTETSFFMGASLLIYLLFATSKKLIPYSATFNRLATWWITAILTFLCILAISPTNKSAHKYLEYLGSLSYPIYMMQGFVLNFPMYYFMLTNISRYPPAKELHWYGRWNRLEIDLYSLTLPI